MDTVNHQENLCLNEESRLSNEERRKKFFYGEAMAGMYDDTIDLVVPQYRLIHNKLVSLLKSFLCNDQQIEPQDVTGTILDIGSGSGTESISALKEFPNIKIVALDLCEPMHQRFRTNFKLAFPQYNIDRYCKLVTKDIAGQDSNPKSLRLLLPEDERKIGFKAVITAFTLHHLDEQEKHEVYSRIYEILEVGGIMINADLFSYESLETTRKAHEYELNWMKKQFENPDSCFTRACLMTPKRRNELYQFWHRHYQEDNILSPMEGKSGQVEMLKSMGFHQVNTQYRHYERGIIQAKK